MTEPLERFSNAPEMPDVTPAQAFSFFTFIIAEAISAVLIDGHTSKLLVGIGGIVIPVVWTIADAIIRQGRAKAYGEIESAHFLSE